MARPTEERELILGILMEVTEKGQYSHIVLRQVLEKYQYLDKSERAFITRVSEGTLEHMIRIDYVLDQFSSVPVAEMKPVIRNILRSAVYQLMEMNAVPDAAACDEAVKLAERKGFRNLKGFVNGVLRAVAKGWKQVSYPTDPVENLSIRYSLPMWILELWQETYDLSQIETMAKAFQQTPDLIIRVNLEAECLQPDPVEKLQKILEAEGARVRRHPYLPYALYLSDYDYLEGMASFQKGLFAVQDLSSMLVGELAAPKEGDQVIELCASPGGKSIHIAEKLHGTGQVEARDLTPSKVGDIQENADRYGCRNLKATVSDALVHDPESVGKADIVVADLPCSGLGVLGKKVDLKYKMTRESADKLADTQRKILSNAQDYVKPGGKLVYSTCTIHDRENLGNVRWFLEQYPQYHLTDIHDLLCPQLQDAVSEKGCLQLLPGIHESDGFFIACLQKMEGPNGS